MMKRLIPIFVTAFLLFGCNWRKNNSGNTIAVKERTPIVDYISINSYPHDTTSFTEGFLFHKGELYESTGASIDLNQTRSLFGIVDLTTGKIDKKVELDREKYFGEGIAFLNGKIFQLTYKTRIGFIYDATTCKKIGEFTFPSKEGWGLTTDGTSLIMTDGTNILTYIEPNTLGVIKTVSVSENGYSTDNLNEMEYINGYIYANIWTTDTIIKINPSDGKVVGKLDLTSLAKEAKNIYPGSLEMNGIAYDNIKDRILVTGKLWPKIYEIKFSY